MIAKFISFCEYHFNGVINFILRVLIAATAIIALITVGNIIIYTL